MELKHEDRWVAGRLATLDPQWRPDFAHGRELLEAGLAKRAYRRPWMAAALAAGMCVAALALPQTRAFGEELWYRFVLNRVDVVRLDLSGLPLHVQVTTNGLERAAQDLDDAERKAGFRPYLPAAGVLPANPALTITGPISVEQTIHAGDIEAALRKVGATDLQVPADWEGARLRTEIGPGVAADYPNGVRILQMQPIAVSVPTGFPLERFAEVAFQSIGVSAWEARALAQKYAANPAWLLDIPAGEAVNVSEVSLGKGPALLIEDLDSQGIVRRATVIRSGSDRFYSVSANSAELGMRVADALP